MIRLQLVARIYGRKPGKVKQTIAFGPGLGETAMTKG